MPQKQWSVDLVEFTGEKYVCLYVHAKIQKESNKYF